ncbi:hypothetical protein BZA77DRAFT_322708 [Pyronema omphalodes]|nr:hypothetical protein BZA77DRAFT_322708 [Pyronema omphalodes]
MTPTLAVRASTSFHSLSKPLPHSPPRKSSWIFGNVAWRPLPLRSGFLFVFALVTAAFIGVLEFILERSQKNGAAFFPTTVFQDYCVNYIPLILGVFYGLAFASVDHDIKRLEPYFQLSKPGGVTAEHSLFLDYPYTLALSAPITALKRKHWVVACSSIALLLITFGVTPLSSAFVSKDTVYRTSMVPITRANLMPLNEQNRNLSAAFSYAAYSAQYLNGTLPPFTTPDYGVLPFKPTDTIQPNTGELWVANTTLYEASLQCTPGTVDALPELDPDGEWMGPQLQVSNADKSCKIMIQADWADKYSPYVAWMINERFLRYRQSLLYHGKSDQLVQCSDEKLKNIMIGFWGRPITPQLVVKKNGAKFMKYEFNRTAVVFCYPKTTAQDVEVTINPKFMDIQNITRREPTTRNFSGINITYWNNIMVGQESAAFTELFNVSTGLVIPKNRRTTWDYFRTRDPSSQDITSKFQGLPDHTSQLLRRPQFHTLMDEFGARPMPDQAEIWTPTVARRSDMFPYDPTQGYGLSGYIRPINTWIPNPNSLTPFGLSLQEDLEALFDHNTLTNMFSTAYRYLFAVAIGAGLSQYNNQTLKGRAKGGTSQAQRQYTQIGYVADVQWVRCLQVVLSLILAAILVLMVLLWNRKCNLSGDPGTLASAMASADEGVLREFEGAEFMTEKELLTFLKKKNYRYCLCEDRIMIIQGPINPVSSSTAVLDQDKVVCHKPWSLTVYVGVFSVLLLITTVIVLVVLFVQNEKYGGFQVPGNNFQYNLYSSYLPTIVAMAFEAFLVLLAGHVALLYPFTQLRDEKKTSSAGPLSINYDKLPPHLQLYGALKTENYLLATLSMSVLIANVIAVALGVLFQKDFKEFYQTGKVNIMGSPDSISLFNTTTLNQGVQHREYDMLYASAGDALGFKPRPWTTEEFYYLSFVDKTSDRDPRANYTAETWGFGVDVTCQPLSKTNINNTWYQEVLTAPINNSLIYSSYPGPWYHQRLGADVNSTNPWAFYAVWVQYMGLPPSPLPDTTNPTTPSKVQTRTIIPSIASEIHSFNVETPKLVPPPTVVTNNPTKTPMLPTVTRSFTSFEGPRTTAIAISTSVTGNFRFTVVTTASTPTASATHSLPTTTVGAIFPTRVFTRPSGNPKLQIELAKRDSLISTTMPDTRHVTGNIITCNHSPKLLKRKLEITNLTEGTIRSEGDIVIPADSQKNKIPGFDKIIENFKTMLVRVNSLDYFSTYRETGPQNWVTFLVQQEGLRLNGNFTIYDNSEESARAMERVYKRLFAIYMQLHSDEIFNTTGKPQESVVGSTFFRKDSRVIMGPIAFWTAAALILLCVPITIWTYTTLFNGFVCHEPTSLAATYAAFYASDAIEDVAGTEGIRSAERAKRLKALGHTYGYGWFLSQDSKKHYGIHRADKRDFGWIV